MLRMAARVVGHFGGLVSWDSIGSIFPLESGSLAAVSRGVGFISSTTAGSLMYFELLHRFFDAQHFILQLLNGGLDRVDMLLQILDLIVPPRNFGSVVSLDLVDPPLCTIWAPAVDLWRLGRRWYVHDVVDGWERR